MWQCLHMPKYEVHIWRLKVNQCSKLLHQNLTSKNMCHCNTTIVQQKSICPIIIVYGIKVQPQFKKKKTIKCYEMSMY